MGILVQAALKCQNEATSSRSQTVGLGPEGAGQGRVWAVIDPSQFVASRTVVSPQRPAAFSFDVCLEEAKD